MRSVALGIVGASLLVAVAGARVQGVSDFSGEWVYAGVEEPGGRSAAIYFPTRLVIRQSAAELRVEGHTYLQEAQVATYRIGGGEVEVAAPAGSATQATAVWSGPRLVITTQRSYAGPSGPVSINSTEIFSLSADRLVIEKSQTIGAVRTAGTGTYKRVS
jgi:hypothetical protein